jgi:hypothetical protein
LYSEPLWRITLGMQNTTAFSTGAFKSLFNQLWSTRRIHSVLARCGVKRRRPPLITWIQLLQGLVFHVVAGAGTLAYHMKQITGCDITDSALAQRRALLPWEVFPLLMESALKPKARPAQHPEAFYQGLRLCGLDGSRFSVANTPSVKRQMKKARSRRGRAAFAQMGVAVLVELGLHNPIAAAVGMREESEMVLARELLPRLPEKSLLIGDRYYGVPEVLVELSDQGQRAFLVRVRKNLQPRSLEAYADGSALVEIRSGQGRRLVREIVGQVRRGRGRAATVRLWTSLLDWRRYPAAELLALYARRWEQETFYKELKVDTRSMPRVQSQTPLTAAQEIAALILAYAVLVDYRLKAGELGQVGVLRISFLKTLQTVRGLWQFLELTSDLLTPKKLRLVVRRALRQIAEFAIPKRRQRSCPRALRQPVSSWPRLRKNTYGKGPVEYSITPAIV